MKKKFDITLGDFPGLKSLLIPFAKTYHKRIKQLTLSEVNFINDLIKDKVMQREINNVFNERYWTMDYVNNLTLRQEFLAIVDIIQQLSSAVGYHHYKQFIK